MARCLSSRASRRATARSWRSTASRYRRRGRGRRAARRQRRRQDDDAARDLRARLEDRRRSSTTARTIRARVARADRAARHRARARRGAGSSRELTVWENLRMGAYIRRDRGGQGRPRARVRLLPVDPRAAQPARGDAVAAASSRCSRSPARSSRGRSCCMLDEPSLGLAPLVTQELFRVVHQLNEQEGLTVLVVEQNAQDRAHGRRTAPTCSRSAASPSRARAPSCASTRASAGRTWATDAAARLHLVGVLPAGHLRPGDRRVYASLALALVLIYRTTHVVNFAQGEMATFTTYIAWTLTEPRLVVLARVLRHDRDRVLPGRGDRARDHPAVRER